MTKVLVTRASLEDTADSIRSKLGVQTTYKPSQFADAIDAITGVSSADNGKVVVNGVLTAQTSKSITTNGTHDTTANDQVVVNVSGGGSSGSVYLINQAKLENILTATNSSSVKFAEGYGQYEIVKYRNGNYLYVTRNSTVENNGAYIYRTYTELVSLVCPTLMQPGSHSKIKIRYFITDKSTEPTIVIGAGSTVAFGSSSQFLMDLKSSSLIGTSTPTNTLFENELDISDVTTPFYFGMFTYDATIYISDFYIT